MHTVVCMGSGVCVSVYESHKHNHKLRSVTGTTDVVEKIEWPTAANRLNRLAAIGMFADVLLLLATQIFSTH